MTRKTLLFTSITLLALSLCVAVVTAQGPQLLGDSGQELANDDAYLPVVMRNFGTYWSLFGNAGTNPVTHFLGTTDNQPLIIKTNGAEAMRVDTTGNVGIGTANPSHKLEVVSGGNSFRVGTANSWLKVWTGGNSRLSLGDGNGNEAGFIAGGENGSGANVLQIAGCDDPGNCPTYTTFHQSGNVGIGTDNPTARLKVVVGPDISGTPSGHAGIVVSADTGNGLFAISRDANGVVGESVNGDGVIAESGAGTSLRVQGGCARPCVSGTDLIRGIDLNAGDLRFVVERATGNVKADGAFTSPADFAEMMAVAGVETDYQPGDVLVIGSDGKVTRSTTPYASNLAGVYSTKPGFVGDVLIGEGGLEALDSQQAKNRAPVALLGIVPVKVTAESGPILPGDLLTTSSTPGHAMKANPVTINGIEIYPTGAILGKALEPFEKGAGMIKVLVTLR